MEMLEWEYKDTCVGMQKNQENNVKESVDVWSSERIVVQREEAS